MIKVFHENGMFLCSEIIIYNDIIKFFGINDNLKYYVKFSNDTEAMDYFMSVSKEEIIDLNKINSEYKCVEKYNFLSLIYT